MKNIILISILICFCCPIVNAKTEIDKAFLKRKNKISSKFTLYSPHIYDNREILKEQIYNSFGCNGKNISPKLIWSGVPKNTKSFAVTIYDKDAKTGSGWWNWIVYNIPADQAYIDMNASKIKKFMPKGAKQGINDYGKNSYGGPCNEKGEKHRYVVTLYSLNIKKINLKKNASPAMIGLYLNKHKIATAQINAFYENKIEKEGSIKQAFVKKGKIKYDTSKIQNKTGNNKGKVLKSKNSNKKVVEEKNEKQ